MIAQIWKNIQNNWAHDLSRRFLWSPVFLGLGIGFYFLLPFEPSLPVVMMTTILFGALLWIKSYRLFVFPLFLIILGVFLATWRTASLQTSLIKEPKYSIELNGIIGSIETLPSNEKRITLDLQDKTRVRLKIKGEIHEDFKIGDHIQGNGHLFPFSVPLIEGTYHFRRQAFFQGLSAQGVLKGETLHVIEKAPETPSLQSLRRSLTEKIYNALPDERGAIVAALITGEKTKISKAVRDDYTSSGLSHILAISGLHVGLVAGFVFFLLRNGLALIPSFSLRFHTKKIAAVLCIPLLFFYMAISGFGTPVIRSFLMTSVVLFGIIVDRISISMNLIAIAAFIILILFPESLLHPSFQLSFAAVFALIAVYESDWARNIQSSSVGWKKILLYCLGLALTSVVATIATFPLTISTFNRFTLHAIEANMLGVPLMGIWIMPLGVFSFLLMPFGLENLALIPMGWGISFLNEIAHEVGSWKGSNIIVSTPPLWALNTVVLSVLWIGVWKAKWRFWGLPFLCIGIFGFIIPSIQKPDLLFDVASKAWALKDGDILLTYPNTKKNFDLELWARALEIQKIETIADHDSRFKCTKWGCILKKEKVYLQFSKYEKKRYKGTVLSYFPRNSVSKNDFFNTSGQGFITVKGFVFYSLKSAKRPWN